MQNWITDIMEQFGYAGIALVIALENLFPPIPSEVILTFGGFMTTKTHLTVPGVILASTIGSVAGAVVLYLIGLLLEVRRLERIVERWGHVLRVKRRHPPGGPVVCQIRILDRLFLPDDSARAEPHFDSGRHGPDEIRFVPAVYDDRDADMEHGPRVLGRGSGRIMGTYRALYGHVLPFHLCCNRAGCSSGPISLSAPGEKNESPAIT